MRTANPQDRQCDETAFAPGQRTAAPADPTGHEPVGTHSEATSATKPQAASTAPAAAHQSAARRAQSAAQNTSSAPMSQGAIILLFIGLMIAMFMFSLNQTVLATALPTIVGELNGVNEMLWVSTAFMLASTIMMPIYGKIGDLFGRKPLFIFAILMFLVGSTFGVLADSMTMLILGRVFQGIGGGGLLILSQAIIASVVPARERGKYMGMMGATFAVSSVAGPLIGGTITEGPGWRWNFALNFPLGALALLAAIFLLKVPKVPAHERPTIDIAGMILIAQFTTSLILVSAWGGHTYQWTDPLIIALAAVALLSAVIFVFVELHAPNPIIPMSVFRDRNFVLCTVAGMFIGVAMFGVLSYMPTYLQMVHGVEATVAGLMMVPMMAGMLVVSTVLGFIVSRTGRYKWYPIVGVLFLGVALFLVSTLQPETSSAQSMLYLAVLGVGLGMSMQILVLVVQNSFPVTMVGTATASNNFFRQVGATLGMSVIGSLFTNRLMNNLSDGLSQAGAQMPASGAGSAQSLTPNAVRDLPAPLHDMVVHAYNDALVPMYLAVVPLIVIAVVLLLFMREKPLATKIESSAASERAIVSTGSVDIVDIEAQEDAPAHDRFDGSHQPRSGEASRPRGPRH